jgi:DNA-binding transcriptional LysR family regulator
LAERQLDLLIARRVEPEDGSRFSFEPLYQDFYVVVPGAQSRWARRRKVTLDELANEAWVLPPPDALVGAAAREAFRAGGIDAPNVTVSTVPREVRTGLVATGRFLTIVPSSALIFLFRRSEIKVVPVGFRTAAPVGIVTVKNRPLSLGAERFAREARELAGDPRAKS